MADTKISALTAASTPLAGTEVLPIVQSGATVKVAVNALNTFAPAFSALTTSDVAASTATWTKVTYASERFDTNSNFASSRFTATVPGYYQINASAYFYPSVVGQCQIAIYKSGSSYLVGTISPNSNQGPACAVSAVIQMLATEYLEIYVFQNSGGDLNFGSTDFSGCFLRGI
jgi:hypothetical protein